jgi:chemotaxis signal transduction protein
MNNTAHRRIALRLAMHSGPCSIPVDRIQHLAGYATLSGKADDYFRGWLTYQGRQVPVFDLNRVLCDEPTPERFGSRIMLLETPDSAPTRSIGLLAPGITDTVAAGDSACSPVDLDSYLPMLCSMIPTPVPSV